MKKLIISLLFLTACGQGGGDQSQPPAPTPTNDVALIGTWKLITSNTSCMPVPSNFTEYDTYTSDTFTMQVTNNGTNQVDNKNYRTESGKIIYSTGEVYNYIIDGVGLHLSVTNCDLTYQKQ